VLVGGLGVSGDGVDQDDFVTSAGTKGIRSAGCDARGSNFDRGRAVAVLQVSEKSYQLKFSVAAEGRIGGSRDIHIQMEFVGGVEGGVTICHSSRSHGSDERFPCREVSGRIARFVRRRRRSFVGEGTSCGRDAAGETADKSR